MVKKLLILAFALFSFFGNLAQAQCIPQNGAYRNQAGFVEDAPRIYNGTCYVPQGTPSVYGGNTQQIAVQQVQQQQIQQQQQQLQQSLMSQAIRLQAGQQVPNGYCSWQGRAENIGIAGFMGAVMGVIAGDNRESARQGAALGMLTGMFVPCSALQQLQQVGQVQQPQQVAVQQQQVQPQQAQQAGQTSTGCEHAPGTRQGILNISGNPKNGQAVCAKPGDPNISQWL